MNNYSNGEHPIKRNVQNLILSSLGKVRSSVLTMLGPDVVGTTHLFDKVITRYSSKIISYEIDEDVFNAQRQKAKELGYYFYHNKIVINHGNIMDAEPTKFIDLDLTGTVRTQKDLIFVMFNKQKNEFGNDASLKVFNYTVSLRDVYSGDSTSDNIEFLRVLLDSPELSCIHKDGAKPVIYKLIDTGRYHVEMYSYRDRGNGMLSVSIQYK